MVSIAIIHCFLLWCICARDGSLTASSGQPVPSRHHQKAPLRMIDSSPYSSPHLSASPYHGRRRDPLVDNIIHRRHPKSRCPNWLGATSLPPRSLRRMAIIIHFYYEIKFHLKHYARGAAPFEAGVFFGGSSFGCREVTVTGRGHSGGHDPKHTARQHERTR